MKNLTNNHLTKSYVLNRFRLIWQLIRCNNFDLTVDYLFNYELSTLLLLFNSVSFKYFKATYYQRVEKLYADINLAIDALYKK